MKNLNRYAKSLFYNVGWPALTMMAGLPSATAQNVAFRFATDNPSSVGSIVTVPDEELAAPANAAVSAYRHNIMAVQGRIVLHPDSTQQAERVKRAGIDSVFFLTKDKIVQSNTEEQGKLEEGILKQSDAKSQGESEENILKRSELIQVVSPQKFVSPWTYL